MIPQHGTLEISRSRFLHNVQLLRHRLESHGSAARLCATIKANAYGHGTAEMTALLREAEVGWVCVYSFDEAMALAHLPFVGILALSPMVIAADEPLSPEILTALRGQIRINITDRRSAERLARSLQRAGIQKPVNVHMQVDAGLTRVGVEPSEAETLAEAIVSLPQLRLEGLFAHLSHGDVPKHETLQQQLEVLHRVAEPLKKHIPHLMLHLQNSGGTWHVQDQSLGMVRAGIALYGLQPSTADWVDGLLPIARVTAPILAIHERPAGTGVGYGHTFITPRQTRLAIVPVGYADGYPRLLSNRMVAQLHGKDVPVVGRISMDQVILDVTDLPSAQVGDIVTVVSWDPAKSNSLDRMADLIGTIGYELATHLGAGGGRLRHKIVE